MRTKVLLVEDDDDWFNIFNILVGDVTQKYFEYTHVSSLTEALNAVKNNEFDLILLDLMLPDSHATNTIEIMTSTVKYIPIVVMSTLDDEKLMQSALQQGAQDYLVKDQYELKTFLHVARQAIRRFIAKSSANVMQELEKTITKLKLLEKKIEEAEKLA